jgi:hypothetical protein
MIVNLGTKPAVYPDGEKLSDVMAWNTYGTETIPPRPVLRIAAEKVLGSEEFKKEMQAYLDNVAVYSLHSPKDLKTIEVKLLVSIGQQSVAEAKRIIDTGAELQHNAPATVRKKGFDQPLYETGLMSKNLGYELSE